jgi:hypothetical protein
LTNFPNGKQTQESLESGFPKNEFHETNMALIEIRVHLEINSKKEENGKFVIKILDCLNKLFEILIISL